MELSKSNAVDRTCCPVVELRQYTLHPGARDRLIELFEREFIESQEAVGMRIIGTFRDLEKPDRFVWLRGFQDMESRAAQLQEFYGGAVWKQHREAANATMIAYDDVLLLRPAAPESGFQLAGRARAEVGASAEAAGIIVATIYHLKRTSDVERAEILERTTAPALVDAGVPVLGAFVTGDYDNTFPALPVREDANVFVVFSAFANRVAYAQSNLGRRLAAKLADQIAGEPEVLFLAPTARSLLRG